MESGNVGDVGDLNNAPVPPPNDGIDMGNEMPDPNMGGEPNVGMEGPNMMDGEPNAMGPDAGMENAPQEGNDELNNVVSNLSLEDQAAVLKYAKSMQKDNEGNNDGMMPESRKTRYNNILNEVIADILHDTEKTGIKRQETKLPRRYKNMNSPFNSPYEQ